MTCQTRLENISTNKNIRNTVNNKQFMTCKKMTYKRRGLQEWLNIKTHIKTIGRQGLEEINPESFTLKKPVCKALTNTSALTLCRAFLQWTAKVLARSTWCHQFCALSLAICLMKIGNVPRAPELQSQKLHAGLKVVLYYNICLKEF